MGALGDARADGLALEGCVRPRLGAGSAMGAFGMSPGINES